MHMPWGGFATQTWDDGFATQQQLKHAVQTHRVSALQHALLTTTKTTSAPLP